MIAITSGLDVDTIELARQIAKERGLECCVEVARAYNGTSCYQIYERENPYHVVQQALFENREFNCHALLWPGADWNTFPEPEKPEVAYSSIVPPKQVEKELGPDGAGAYMRFLSEMKKNGKGELGGSNLLAIVQRGPLKIFGGRTVFDFYVGYPHRVMRRWQVLPEGPFQFVGLIEDTEQPKQWNSIWRKL